MKKMDKADASLIVTIMLNEHNVILKNGGKVD